MCDEIIPAIEESWDVQVGEMGFPPPVPDDDGILDVYIDAGDSAYGAYAWGTSIDADTHDDRMGSPAYIAIHPDYDEEVRWTMLHEFNHVLQYAIDFTEPRYVPWEGAASAAEVWTDPTLAVERGYVADFQDTPWLGLMGDSWQLWDDYEIWSYYEYGSALWFQHLDAWYGDGAGSAGVEFWLDSAQDGWENEPDFIDASGQWTGDWAVALMDFSVERARIGTSDAPTWAANLSKESLAVSVEASLGVDELPAVVTPAWAPFQTGVVYAEVTGLTEGEHITIAADGAANIRWALLVVDGKSGDWTEDGSLTWIATNSEIVVGVVHLGGPDFDSDNRRTQASVAIHVALGDSAGGDTGFGAAGGVGSGSKECSCGPGLGTSGWWLMALVPLIRRRPTGSPDAEASG